MAPIGKKKSASKILVGKRLGERPNEKWIVDVRNFNTDSKYFMFCWPCISIHPCNENQPDALIILSVFRQSIVHQVGFHYT